MWPLSLVFKGLDMSVSSGTKSLFSTLIACLAVAAASAYVLKHRDEVKRAVSEVSSRAIAKSSTGKPASVEQSASEDLSPVDNDGVTLKANANGHFEADAEINGRSIGVMVDTGATMVALTYEDAERSGIFLRPSDFTGTATTANGVSKIAPVKIGQITIGGITVRDVDGAVAERGKMRGTLLGMSFLSRLSRVDMRARSLVLHQ